MSSGATCSAGRQKKAWGRAGSADRSWRLWEWLGDGKRVNLAISQQFAIGYNKKRSLDIHGRQEI